MMAATASAWASVNANWYVAFGGNGEKRVDFGRLSLDFDESESFEASSVPRARCRTCPRELHDWASAPEAVSASRMAAD